MRGYNNRNQKPMTDKEYRDYDEGSGKALGYALGVTLSIFAAIIIGVAIMLSSGCTTTKYVPVETVRTEYRDREVERITTDTLTNTRFVFIKGDTVLDIREKERIHRVEIHDTLVFVRTDSIPMPYPVEKPLTKWQQTKMDIGGMAIGGLGIIILAFFIWLIFKIRRKV